jgi:hypothetical protein
VAGLNGRNVYMMSLGLEEKIRGYDLGLIRCIDDDLERSTKLHNKRLAAYKAGDKAFAVPITDVLNLHLVKTELEKTCKHRLK